MVRRSGPRVRSVEREPGRLWQSGVVMRATPVRDAAATIQVVAAAALALVAVALHALGSHDVMVWALDLALYAAAAATARWRLAGAVTLLALGSWLVGRGALTSIGEHALLLPLLGVSRGPRLGYAAHALLAVGILGQRNVRPEGPAFPGEFLILWALLAGFVWALGEGLGYVSRLQRRARENALAVQQVVVARELHDSVAHGLSLIVMQARHAKLQGSSSATHLDPIIATAEKSLHEVRTMMHALRTDDASEQMGPERAQPVQVAELLAEGVETLRDAGFQPTLQIEGNPTPIREPARDALVKASREAIENIRRHGDPAESCSIMVAATPSHLELVFVNVPRGDGSSAATKLGLIGMKERLEELGGTVETVRGARQWLTRLVLPLGAASRSRSAHA